jgi:hypothetical protein
MMQELPNPQPRMNTRKLTLLLVFGLLLPVSSALAVDLFLGSLPVVSIVAVVICFPVAAILISRTALSELDRVIQVVAPIEAPIETAPQAEEASVVPPDESVPPDEDVPVK